MREGSKTGWHHPASPQATGGGVWGWVGKFWLPALTVVALGGAFVIGSLGDSDDRTPEETKIEKRARLKERNRLVRKRNKPRLPAVEAVRVVMPKTLPAPEVKRRRWKVPPKDMFAHLEGDDKKLVERLQTALDEENFELTREIVAQAMNSENDEVRDLAVDALGWFGAQALPELTGCMLDKNAEIREKAENLWEVALADIPDTVDQFNISSAALGSLTDEDQLASLSGIVSGAAMTLIDGAENEELEFGYRVEIVQQLVDIIEGEDSRDANVFAAAEAYEEITGNEWMGVDAAERYLRDPENYDPDEEPGENLEAGEGESAGADFDGQ